jgi:galactokinase
MREKILAEFEKQFGGSAGFVVRAPGRVNLIGEHTDYNDGFVMPLAIERATWIALRRRADSHVYLHSVDFGETEEIQLGAVEKGSGGPAWAEYLRGVAWAMGAEFDSLSGWEGVSSSNLPIGAGLSSSASFELATAGAFAAVAGLEWNAERMAVICHRAEVEWVGVNCGMMDHLASAQGKAGHALLIDCRTLKGRAIPLPAGTVVVIMDTRKARTLAGSAYNERRAQCEEAARFLGVGSLRDVTEEMLEAAADRMDSLIYRRARHVVSENTRTLAAAEAMEKNDAAQLGRLMGESHESLRVDYEVSCPELDAIVACAQSAPGCIGARMTGAGFGGCAVALVAAEAVEGFVARVERDYAAKTGLAPKLYASAATDGVETFALTTKA